jgi:hypothetical protein
MKNILGIAIPTYKREKMLVNLLETIPKTIPVYVSDNGCYLSDDIQKNYPHAIIKKTAPEVAMFANWNLAASMVQDEWLAITSDDDIYYPDRFEFLLDSLTRYSDMDMIIFGYNTIDEFGSVIQEWTPYAGTYLPPDGFIKYKYGINARMPSIFFKTSFFNRLKGFNESFKLTASDSELIQRAMMVGKVKFIPEIIAGYRLWDGGLTSSGISTHEWMDEIDAWSENMLKFSIEEKLNVYSRRVQDEIYAANLISGIASLKKHSRIQAAWLHFKRCRYPYRARLLTQLRLLYSLARRLN